MPSPNYVILVQSDPASSRRMDMVFVDDVEALIVMRRLFVRELAANGQRPLSFCVGRRAADGKVDWLTRWNAGAPAPRALPPARAGLQASDAARRRGRRRSTRPASRS